MKRQIHVVFENGVLRPLEPIDFAEKQELVITVNDGDVNVPPAPPKSPFVTRMVEYNPRIAEYKWLKEHRDEYLDQWVVVEGDQLVSHGMDGKAVYKQAREAGVDTPFLVHVTLPDGLPWGGW